MSAPVLSERWRARALDHQRDGALVRGDLVWQRAADELEAWLATRDMESMGQTEAAREVGVTTSTVRRWEREGKLARIDPDRARYRRRDVLAAARGEAPPRGLNLVSGRR
jgi:hypothetical protein